MAKNFGDRRSMMQRLIDRRKGSYGAHKSQPEFNTFSSSTPLSELSQEELDNFTKEELQQLKEAEERRKLYEEQLEIQKEREEMQEALAEYNRQLEERKRKDAVYDEALALAAAESETSGFLSNLINKASRFIEGIEGVNERRRYFEKDGQMFKRVDIQGWSVQPGQGMLQGMVAHTLFGAPPAIPVSEEEAADVMREQSARIASDGWYDAGYKTRTSIGNIAKFAIVDSYTGLLDLSKGFGNDELGSKIRQRIGVSLLEFVYDGVDWINRVIAPGLPDSDRATDARKARKAKMQSLDKDIAEIYKSREEDESKGPSRWENFVDETLGVSNTRDYYLQQQQYHGLIYQTAADMEGRETKELIDSADFEEPKKDTFEYYRDVDGEQISMERPLEKLPEGSENFADTQTLVFDSSGEVVTDDYGEPLYESKYSWIDKVKNANIGQMFTDKYASNDFLNGMESSVGFLIGGGGIGAGVRGVSRVAGRGLSRAGRGVVKGSDWATKGGVSRTGSKFQSLVGQNTQDYALRNLSRTRTFGEGMVNSYLMTNTESQMIGHETAKNVYEEGVLKELGLDRDSIKETLMEENPDMDFIDVELISNTRIAREIRKFEEENPELASMHYARARASNHLASSINNLNMFLNLNYGIYFAGKTRFSTRGLKNPMSTKGLLRGSYVLGKEAGHEYLEEGLMNNYSQDFGEAIARGEIIGFDDYLENDFFSAENITEGLHGALSSFFQSGFTQGTSSLRDYKSYKQRKKVLDRLTETSDFNKENIKKLLEISVSEAELDAITAEVNRLTKEGKHEEAAIHAEKTLIGRAVRAAVNGTTIEFRNHLESLLQNDDFDAETVQGIKDAIAIVEKAGSVFDNHIQYSNINSIIANRLNRDAIERRKNYFESELLPGIQKRVDDAIAREARKKIAEDPNLSDISDYRAHLNQLIDKTKLSKNSPEMRDMEKAIKSIAHAEVLLDQNQEQYEALIDKKNQEKYRENIRKAKLKKKVEEATEETSEEVKSEATETNKNKVDGETNNEVDNEVYNKRRPKWRDWFRRKKKKAAVKPIPKETYDKHVGKKVKSVVEEFGEDITPSDDTTPTSVEPRRVGRSVEEYDPKDLTGDIPGVKVESEQNTGDYYGLTTRSTYRLLGEDSIFAAYPTVDVQPILDKLEIDEKLDGEVLEKIKNAREIKLDVIIYEHESGHTTIFLEVDGEIEHISGYEKSSTSKKSTPTQESEGQKQINKAMADLKKTLPEVKGESLRDFTNSLYNFISETGLKLTDKQVIEIFHFFNTVETNRRQNEALVDSSSRIRLFDAQVALSKLGYENATPIGIKYQEGMNLTPEFIESEDLLKGERVITIIRRPQINKNGKMIQSAEVVVSVGTKVTEQSKKSRIAKLEREKQARLKALEKSGKVYHGETKRAGMLSKDGKITVTDSRVDQSSLFDVRFTNKAQTRAELWINLDTPFMKKTAVNAQDDYLRRAFNPTNNTDSYVDGVTTLRPALIKKNSNGEWVLDNSAENEGKGLFEFGREKPNPTKGIVDEAARRKIIEEYDSQIEAIENEVLTEDSTPELGKPSDESQRIDSEESLFSPAELDTRDLGAPAEYDDSNEAHRNQVEEIANGIRSMLKESPHVDFERFVVSVMSQEGSVNTENIFNFLAEAWDRATGTKMGDAEANRVYRTLFGDVSPEGGHFSKGAFKVPTSTPKRVDDKREPTQEEKEEEDTKPESVTGTNPLTKIKEVFYEGYKIAEHFIKAAYLGQNYTLIDNGRRFVTNTNEINPDAHPALHWHNFREGDQVEVSFDFSYFKNPSNTIRIWDETNPDRPTFNRVSVFDFIENIFGEGSFQDVMAKMDTAEGRKELLSNEEFLRYAPTAFTLDGEQVSMGMNDYYWWNAMNVALPIDRETGQPLRERQRRVIERARKSNLETRKMMVDSESESVTMTVRGRRSGVSNTLREDVKGMFQSVTDAFKGNKEAARAYIGFAAIGRDGKIVTKESNGVSVIEAGKEAIDVTQIVNLESYLDRGGRNKAGEFVMIQQVGVDKNGIPLYSINGIIDNHTEAQERYRTLRSMIGVLENYGRVLQGNWKNPTANMIAKAQKAQKYIGEAFGFDIATIELKTHLTNFYPGKSNSKANDGKFRQDYSIEAASIGETIDLLSYDTVEAFEQALLKGELKKISHKDILLDNVHTQFVFTEINHPSQPSIWSSDSQPVIDFTDDHLSQDVKKELDDIDPTVTDDSQDLATQIKFTENRIKMHEDALSKETNTRRKRRIQEEITKLKKELENLKNQEKLSKATDAAVKKVAPRAPEESDIIGITQKILFDAFRKIDLASPFTKSNILDAVEVAYHEFKEHLEKHGTEQEIAFLKSKEGLLLGKEGYDGSPLEAIDAIFSKARSEEITQDSENIRNYSRESFEEIVTTSLSDRVKVLFSGLTMQEQGDGFTGVPVYMTFEQSIDALQQRLEETESNNLQELIERMVDRYEWNPAEFGFYQDMITILQDLDIADSSLLNEILYNLNQPKVDMAFIMYNVLDNGNFVAKKYDANSKNSVIQTRQQWTEFMKNSPLIRRKGRDHYIVNDTEAQKVYKLYDEIQEGIKKGDIPLEAVDAYLKYFGIHMHPAALKAMKDNSFGKPELTFYTEGMVVSEKTGRSSKTGEVFGIFAGKNSLGSLLLKNLDTALQQQNIGDLLDNQGRIRGRALNALFKDNPKIAAEYRAIKSTDQKKQYLVNKAISGEIKVGGKTLAFSDRGVSDKNSQVALNLLTNDTNNALKVPIGIQTFMTFTPKASMRIAGKPINAYQQPQRLKNILKKLKKHIGEGEEGYIEELLETQINSNSFLLKTLKEIPELKDDFDVILMSLESLKKLREDSRDDMGINEISDKDAFVVLFNMFAHNEGKIDSSPFQENGVTLRKGTVPFPTLSDSSQMPLMVTPLVDLSRTNFVIGDNSGKLKPEFLDFYRDSMVRGDFERISSYLRAERLREYGEAILDGAELKPTHLEEVVDYLEQYRPELLNEEGEFDGARATEIGEFLNNEHNIKGFNVGAEYISSIISLNSVMVDVTADDGSVVQTTLIEAFKKYGVGDKLFRDNIDLFFDTYYEEISRELQRNIDEEVNTYISNDGTEGFFIDNGIYKDGKIDFIDTKYLESKGEMLPLQKARLIAYDYVINSHITQRDIQNTFAADVANYFRDWQGDNLDFGMPRVTLADLMDHYYPEFTPEQRKRIEDNLDNTENLELLRETHPELLSAAEISMNPLSERMEHISPIFEKKMEDMFRVVQENIAKRLKSLISPGSQLPDSQGGRKYLQFMLEDVENASEVLENVIELLHPGKLDEVIKSQDGKTLRDLVEEFKSIDVLYPDQRKDRGKTIRHKELFEIISDAIPNAADFLKTASTDAQEYVTWRDNLHQLREQGRLFKHEFDAIVEKFEAQDKDIEEFGYITEENKWQPDEADLKAKAMMQPSKPLYSGTHIETINGHTFTRDVYIKSSSFPLIPELAAMMPKIRNLKKNLERFQRVENGELTISVRASYQTANKVGATKEGVLMSELYKENPNMDILSKSVVELDRGNFFIQQDVPFDPDAVTTNRATQFEKILLGDGINKITEPVFDNYFDSWTLEEAGVELSENGKLTGVDLKKLYDSIYEREQRLLRENLFRRLGITSYGDINTGKPKAMENLIDILRSKLDNKQDRELLHLDYFTQVDGKEVMMSKKDMILQGLQPTRAALRMPLYMMPNSRKMESVLNSVINSNSIRLENAGTHSPVGSQEGFDFRGFEGQAHYESLKEKGLIVTKNFDPKVGLKPTFYDETGELKSAQVFVSNKIKVRNEETGKMELLDLTQYVDDRGVLQLPDEVIKSFSFRIPTSSHQSGVQIEIAGFLPDTMGDLMIVPKDHTIQIGEDFDIDTRYSYNFHLVRKKDGTVKKKEFADIQQDFTLSVSEGLEVYNREVAKVFDKHSNLIENETYRKFFREDREDIVELASLVNEAMNLDEDSGELAGEIDAEIDQLRENIMYRNGHDPSVSSDLDILVDALVEEFDTNKTLTTALDEYKRRLSYNNEMLELAQNDVVGLYNSVFSSNSREVQTLINKVLTTERAQNTADAMYEKIRTDDKVFNLYHPTRQREIMKAGANGKIGIGEHSNAVTMNSLFQQSEHEHKIVQRFDREGNPIFFNIPLGDELVFDGVMGKIEVNGVRISELGMESQNSATDNQNLGIMGKRNENTHTMTVLKILQANGIEKDSHSEYSYSSLFINQPIIRRYAELMERYSSETSLEYGIAQELTEEALLEEFGKNLDDIWRVDKNGEPVVGDIDPYIYQDLGMKANSMTLWENLREEDASNYTQWFVYQTFKHLQGAAKKYNDLQQFINIEKDGLGLSYFDVIALKDKLISIVSDPNPDITNMDKMIGEAEKITFDEYFDNIEREMEKSGYVRVADQGDGAIFIKPSNHYAHKIVNSIATGYNLYSSLFPYENSPVETQIDNILEVAELTEGSKKETELKYEIIARLKDYSYTNNKTLFGDNFDDVVDRLFFDNSENNNQSLASYLVDLQTNTEYNGLFKRPFFNSLRFDIHEGDYPSLIAHENASTSKYGTLGIFNTLSTMVDSNKTLPDFNGEEYTEAKLMRDLLRYSMIADQGNGAIGFRHHLPPRLMDKFNVTESISKVSDPNLRMSQETALKGVYSSLQSLLGSQVNELGVITNLNALKFSELESIVKDYNKQLQDLYGVENTLTLNRNGDITIENFQGESYQDAFTKQFIQHNPSVVPAMGQYRVKKTEHGNVTEPNRALNRILKNNNIKGDDLSKVNSLYIKSAKEFVRLKDKNNNSILFQRIGDNHFKRINTLGVFGMNEYRIGRDIETSKIGENNKAVPEVYTERLVFEDNQVPLEFDPVKVVQDIFNDMQNPYQGIMSVIGPHIDFSTLKIKTAEFGSEGGNAVYKKGTNEFTISRNFLRSNPTEKEFYAVVTEELLHIVTTQAVESYVDIYLINDEGRVNFRPKTDENGNPVTVPAEIINLMRVYNKAIEHIANKQGLDNLLDRIRSRKRSFYGDEIQQGVEAYRVSNIHEFIAGIFIKDKDFAVEMANTQYMQTDKSIFEKFTEALARLLYRILPNKRQDTISAEVARELYSLLNRGTTTTKKPPTEPKTPTPKRTSREVLDRARKLAEQGRKEQGDNPPSNRKPENTNEYLDTGSKNFYPGAQITINGIEAVLLKDNPDGTIQILRRDDNTIVDIDPDVDNVTSVDINGNFQQVTVLGNNYIVFRENSILKLNDYSLPFADSDMDGVIPKSNILDLAREQIEASKKQREGDDVSVDKNSFEYKGVTIPTKFALGRQQAQALKGAIDYLSGDGAPGQQFFAIEGSAGTGKTTIIGYLEQYMNKEGYRDFKYLAPTHAATAQLALTTTELGNTDMPGTVASAINEVKTKDGKTDYVFNYNYRDVGRGTVLVVDETSMLSTSEAHFLIKLANRKDAKIVFMGDSKQIPSPKKENRDSDGNSVMNEVFGNENNAILTEVFRQTESDLLTNLDAIKENIDLDPTIVKTEGDDSITILDDSEYNSERTQAFIDNPEGTIAIAYRNSTVARINREVKTDISGNLILVPGDKIVGYAGGGDKKVSEGKLANSIQYVVSDILQRTENPAYAFVTAESTLLGALVERGVESIVSKVNTSYVTISKFDTVKLPGVTQENMQEANREISAPFARMYDEYMKIYSQPYSPRKYGRQKEMEKKIREAKSEFDLGSNYVFDPSRNLLVHESQARNINVPSIFRFDKGMDFGFAVTAHKAQGMTVDRAFIDFQDIVEGSRDTKVITQDGKTINTEKNALYYVAMSRARNNVTIQNSPLLNVEQRGKRDLGAPNVESEGPIFDTSSDVSSIDTSKLPKFVDLRRIC